MATPPSEQVDRVSAAIAALRRGRLALVTCAEAEYPEGACVVVASRVTPTHVNFMVTHARGLVCVALSQMRSERLRLKPQAPGTRHPRSDQVLTSVEARTGVTTGISAADRARTVRMLADERTLPDDVVTPGHVVPVAVSSRGVFSRPQIPEAAIDLVRIAGFPPVAGYCKILGPEGDTATIADIHRLGAEHGLPVVDLQELKQFRMRQEILVTCESEERYDTEYGPFSLKVYRSDFDPARHLALVLGDVTRGTPLCRVHSQCLTGDVFGSQRCDCGDQLELALKTIANEQCGVVVYLLQEGRGIGLTNKVRAYALQDSGQDTVEANLSLGFEADPRDFGIAAQILAHLGISQCRLLTNNPRKVRGLESFGVEVAERLPLEVEVHEHRSEYLQAKKQKLGHLLKKV